MTKPQMTPELIDLASDMKPGETKSFTYDKILVSYDDKDGFRISFWHEAKVLTRIHAPGPSIGALEVNGLEGVIKLTMDQPEA